MAQHDPRLINDDLAPTTPEQRTWSKWHIAALWVGMAVCIPTYMMAGDLIAQGLSLKMALLAIGIGNVVVLLPLILNGHPGTKYGIPFPVLLRSSFGVLGSNIPALMRALVACGWFGIQTWIGGYAIWVLMKAIVPASWSIPNVMPAFMGITTAQFLCFVAFWLINVAIIWRGMDTLKVLETAAAPFLILMGLALFGWAWWKLGQQGAGLGELFKDTGSGTVGGLGAIGAGITASVAFWGTLALNIPDFSRFARSQRDQAIGQAISLPATMTLFAFIGAAVTGATAVIFGGAPIGNPIDLLPKIGGPLTIAISLFCLAIATLSTNLAANVVSPANDLSNLAPRTINFRRGALIAATIGFVIMPWKLLAAGNYVFLWLGGYGSLLGAIGGIMIVDYFLLRRTQLEVDDLYRRGGQYEYSRGFNPIAIIALVVGVAPLFPGFLAKVGLIAVPSFFESIYSWSWFVSFALAGTTHFVLSKLIAKPAPAAGGSAIRTPATPNP